MATTTATTTAASKNNRREYGFATSADAWTFFRKCETHEIIAGFPSLRPAASGLYTVEILAPLKADGIVADTFGGELLRVWSA